MRVLLEQELNQVNGGLNLSFAVDRTAFRRPEFQNASQYQTNRNLFGGNAFSASRWSVSR